METSKKYLLKKIKYDPESSDKPFDIKYYGNFDYVSIPKVVRYFKDNYFWYVVMELPAGLQMSKFLLQNPELDYETVKYIVGQLLDFLNYIHSLRLQHRNLNTENIFIDPASYRIAVLNMASVCDINHVFESSEYEHVLFAAPEQIKGVSDLKVDMWAVGIILYLLLYNESPYDLRYNSMIILQTMVQDGKVRPRKSRSRTVDPVWELMLDMILEVDSAQRPRVSQLLSHYLFKEEKITKSKNYLAHHPFILNMVGFTFENVIPNIMGSLCDTSMSTDQLSIFNIIDVNRTGFIDLYEVEELFNMVYHDTQLSSFIAQNIIQEFDLNGNKRIDFFEFKVLSYQFGLKSLHCVLSKFEPGDFDESMLISMEYFIKKVCENQPLHVTKIQMAYPDIFDSVTPEMCLLDLIDMLLIKYVDRSYSKSTWYYMLEMYVYNNNDEKEPNTLFYPRFLASLKKAIEMEIEWTYQSINDIKSTTLEICKNRKTLKLHRRLLDTHEFLNFENRKNVNNMVRRSSQIKINSEIEDIFHSTSPMLVGPGTMMRRTSLMDVLKLDSDIKKKDYKRHILNVDELSEDERNEVDLDRIYEEGAEESESVSQNLSYHIQVELDDEDVDHTEEIIDYFRQYNIVKENDHNGMSKTNSEQFEDEDEEEQKKVIDLYRDYYEKTEY